MYKHAHVSRMLPSRFCLLSPARSGVCSCRSHRPQRPIRLSCIALLCFAQGLLSQCASEKKTPTASGGSKSFWSDLEHNLAFCCHVYSWLSLALVWVLTHVYIYTCMHLYVHAYMHLVVHVYMWMLLCILLYTLCMFSYMCRYCGRCIVYMCVYVVYTCLYTCV